MQCMYNKISSAKQFCYNLVPASIIISPPVENASVGFVVKDEDNESQNVDKDTETLNKTITVVSDKDDKNKSMFSPVKKTAPIVIPASEHSLIGSHMTTSRSTEGIGHNVKSVKSPRKKQKGRPIPLNVQKAKEESSYSQGMLTPPLLHKGSREFALELEKRNLEYRKIFIY